MVRPKCAKVIKFEGCIESMLPSCPIKQKEEFIQLLPEELQALSHADANGLNQTAAALQMGISQSTFQRILTNARKKTATALMEGRGITLIKK